MFPTKKSKMDNQDNQAMSHKGEQRRKFSMEFKKNVIKYAKENSLNSASKKFNIDRKRVREWVGNEEKVASMKEKRFRLDGGGRKLTDSELEEEVLNWIHERRSNMLRVSRKLIMFKAKSIFDEKCGDDELLKKSFVASNGWLEKFMKRNHLSLRRKTTIAQKDPSHLISKLVGYLMHVRRLSIKSNYPPSSIIAMDETAVWSDMVGNTTVNSKGAKEVALKSTGNEKVRVSVCLTAKADGTKMKPFIVFKGAKRESAAINDEFKSQCVVTSSTNGWMNEELVLTYLRKILGMFTFQKRLLAWDTFEAHMTEPVKKLLKEMKTDDTLIPGGCTKYIQAPDVCWNKPFKSHIMELYDEWLASGVHEYTEAGNMKAAPRRLVVTWILQAWSRLDKTLVQKSFKSCGLNLKTDGSEDDLIHCFKDAQPCASGSAVLKDQVQLLKDADVLDKNPFQTSTTDSDVEEANIEDNLIDLDDMEK